MITSYGVAMGSPISTPRSAGAASPPAPVQPVWWLAPRPAPLSPWKYSWNRTQSRQCGSLWKLLGAAEDRAAAVGVAQEDAASAAATARRRPRQSVSICAGAGRALDPEVVAVVVVELLQRLDQQVVDREPDRPAPVRVAAEQAGASTRPARSRRGARARRRASTYGCVAVVRATARGRRRATGTRSRRACARAAASGGGRVTSDSRRRSPSPGVVPARRRCSASSGRLSRNHSHAPLEAGQPLEHLRLERLDREERDQARPASAPSAACALPSGRCSTS